MNTIEAHIQKEHYTTSISNGKNKIIADEPIDLGGKDEGLAPDELLCGALAACTAITLRMYADRKEWKLEDVKVNISLKVDKANGVSTFYRDIELIGDLDATQRQRLIEIAHQCPIHKVLSNPISIETKSL
ncbi:MAG: OsmC family peroxiredoxin [Cytophagales bacterium]|nr:MAG: OsmC family peroxiredoxin [Cytophagales bacterium]